MKTKFSLSDLFIHCLFALGSVAVVTIILKYIGRDILGEAVIALLYLLPVGWSAARWGQGPGLVAAVAASLTFDYFFIPPFNTLVVGRLEGWLVLVIFLIVAIVVVGRIQSGLSRARSSERDAVYMYELSASLAGLRTRQAVVQSLAKNLQQMFQAELVEVAVQGDTQSSKIVVKVPSDQVETDKPDRCLPIMESADLVGEIRVWRGHGWLPPADSRILNNFATQASQALERARLSQIEARSTATDSNARYSIASRM